VLGTRKFLGHFDRAGNFNAEDSIGFSVDAPPGIGQAKDARIANLPANGIREQVFEYRSGRLVKGTLEKNGGFVPERGSEVISFQQYIPIRCNLRIYNLPGKFVEKIR
jgi:hypothetical protein